MNCSLKLAILSIGLSQADFALAAGMHESTLSRLVRGRRKPSPKDIEALTRVFGEAETRRLLDGSDQSQSQSVT